MRNHPLFPFLTGKLCKGISGSEISAFFEIYVSVWNYRYTIAVYCCIYYGDTG